MTANAIPAARPHAAWQTLRAYVAITKPRIILLLLVTTVPAMVLAEGGWPSTWLVIATLVGGTASAGGANAVNCWYDRDIDALMKRTRQRPVVTGEIAPAHALTFGIALAAGASAFLWVAATPAAALLAGGAFLFYVGVYTAWLKRRSTQNIVIGGAAGAFPPMVGWAAVTGGVSWEALVMFGVVFLWTPPHFWALALRLEPDYREAGVPMLPVVAGAGPTRRAILTYAIVLAPAPLLLLLGGDLGWPFAALVVGSGAWLVWLAYRLWRRPATTSSMGVYTYSLLYLATVFAAIAVDVAIRG